MSNTGPKALTISQVIVDDSVWNFSMTPDQTLKRFEEGKITIYYPWVAGDPHTILLLSENGIITEAVIDAAALTPEVFMGKCFELWIYWFLCRRLFRLP